ncbi:MULTISPECIES: helix-turn-helix transcriptional regulator [unclassified Nocardioides]|uniref:helix-turn-helix transcriptional regulator n=1 Tax=unclassified Nocardioides TaxID=2615069 RepID=UPI003621D727
MSHVVMTSGLLGRESEQRHLTQLIGRARNGQGGALLLLGEPGIGKSALLDDAVSRAAGVRLLRLDGHEAESTIPYAGVQRLAIPLRHHVDELPARQQDALRIAAGVAEGPAPDRFLVGLGVLGLLATAAEVEPIVCAIDDAHLLDQESLEVLAFVARRIEVEPVGLLFAAREENDVRARLSGVRDLLVDGLGPDAAVGLLTRALPDPVDPAAATQIAQATGGNPLALIDLAQELSSDRLSAVGLSVDPVPIGRRLEGHYVRRVRAAGPRVQEWVLLAAADTSGSVVLVRAAAEVLGIDAETGDLAEVAGLVELDESVRFRHPLVRSAVYNAATGAERRRVHRALAEAATSLGLVELEAWHAARATLGVDPAVADRLERAADLAAARGGLASRSTLLARAAELTGPGPLRSARLVGAAEAALGVGAAQTARAHLDAIARDSTDPMLRGRIIRVECQLAMFTVDATMLARCSSLLVEAADHFHGRDPAREQDALLQAFQFLMTADRRAEGITPTELGRRLTAAAASADGAYATMLTGMGALMLLPYAEAVPLVRAAFDEIGKLPDHQLAGMASAIGSLGTFLWDDGGRRDLLDRASVAARQAGALNNLDALLWVSSLSELWGGTVRRAVEDVEHVREVRRVMGYDAENVINASVMAWTDYPRELVHAIGEGAGAVGFGGVWAAAVATLATRDLAEGQYRDAYDKLLPLVEESFLQVGPTYFPDFVEAAARTDRPEVAARYVADLEGRAGVNGSAWCAGLAARSRALVAPPEEAEQHYLAALDHLDGTTARVDLGRTHLLYGEWLRRVRRRAEASRQLALAHAVLEQAGADMFLPRARAELEATGAAVDATGPAPHHALTPQELSISRLAGEGNTNAEIGAQLFISPNTVDYHLRKVFQKLGISSRRQLTDRLDGLGH